MGTVILAVIGLLTVLVILARTWLVARQFGYHYAMGELLREVTRSWVVGYAVHATSRARGRVAQWFVSRVRAVLGCAVVGHDWVSGWSQTAESVGLTLQRCRHCGDRQLIHPVFVTGGEDTEQEAVWRAAQRVIEFCADSAPLTAKPSPAEEAPYVYVG